MTTIAFLPDRNPELTMMLNDIAWLSFVTPIAPFMIQNVAIGVAILGDEHQTLPRWVAYVNFWVALSFIPDPFAFFFHSDPLAWRGILVLWWAFAAYGVFVAVMALSLSTAIRNSSDPKLAVSDRDADSGRVRWPSTGAPTRSSIDNPSPPGRG